VYIIDFCFLFLVFCAFHLVAPPPSFPTQKQIVRVVSQIIYFTLALFYFRAFICLHCYRLVLLFLFNFFIPYFCCLYFLCYLFLFCLLLPLPLLLPIMRTINVLYRDQSQMKVCQGYGPQKSKSTYVCVCVCRKTSFSFAPKAIV